MRPVKDFALSVADLGLGSVVLWVRLWPQLTALWLGGWLFTEVCTRITTMIPLDYVWLALGVFALGFLGTLGAIVLMLRLVAEHLDLWDLVPEDETDRSVSHVLAITLLPFLGIYAAVNEVAARADELTAMALIQTGILSDQTIITELNPFGSPERLWFVVGLVVGLYILRRVVDVIHDKTEWRPLGVVVTGLEAYFLLVVIMSGSHVLARLQNWWEDRSVVQWFDDMGTAISAFFRGLGIDWPPIFGLVAGFVTETVWPLFLDALVQPVIWLAVAALVFGSKVLSVADLWRQGRPLTAQAPAPKRLRRLQRMRSHGTGSRGGRRAWLEFQEVFLGDIDDKYLPAFQSLRLVLRAGLSFLAAYVVIYTLWTVLHTGFSWVVINAFGGHEVIFWLKYGTVSDIIIDGLFEPLRMCLLALAFHRCLAVFRSRAEGQPSAVGPSAVEPSAVEPSAVEPSAREAAGEEAVHA